MNQQTTAPVAPEEYQPGVVTEIGTVTGATLGSNKRDGQDDTEYWH
ncbi:hypothetical protein ACFV0C_35115 [Streptomyces sp. NPDC059568]